MTAFEATDTTVSYTQVDGERVLNGGTAEIKCGTELIGKYTCIDGKWEESCITASGNNSLKYVRYFIHNIRVLGDNHKLANLHSKQRYPFDV